MTLWEQRAETRFKAEVQLEGIDRRGILQEISAIVSGVPNIDLREFAIEATNEVFNGHLVVKVTDTEAVDTLCAQLKKINGVTAATRI